jgi:DNA adenine methylase
MGFSGVSVSGAQFRLPTVPETNTARPFLKWAGGKTRLLTALRRYRPPTFGSYFEPFLGGGAFFFDTAPQVSVLGDSNAELVSCYEVVRDSPNRLLEQLRSLIVSESEYYRIRALVPESLPCVRRCC